MSTKPKGAKRAGKPSRAATQQPPIGPFPPRTAIRDHIIESTDDAVVLHVITSYNQPPLLGGRLTLAMPKWLRSGKTKPKKKRASPRFGS